MLHPLVGEQAQPENTENGISRQLWPRELWFLSHDRDAPIAFCPFHFPESGTLYGVSGKLCPGWPLSSIVRGLHCALLCLHISAVPQILVLFPQFLLNFWDSTVSSHISESTSDLMDFLIVSDEWKITRHSGFDEWVETQHRLHYSPSGQQHLHPDHCV